MVWLDNPHPIQRLWLMGLHGFAILPPLLLPLPLLLPPLVKVSVGEEEGRHTLSPGHLFDPGRRHGEALATDKNPLKCTLKEPGSSSKCICHGQPHSLQVPESFMAG